MNDNMRGLKPELVGMSQKEHYNLKGCCSIVKTSLFLLDFSPLQIFMLIGLWMLSELIQKSFYLFGFALMKDKIFERSFIQISFSQNFSQFFDRNLWKLKGFFSLVLKKTSIPLFCQIISHFYSNIFNNLEEEMKFFFVSNLPSLSTERAKQIQAFSLF